MRKLVFFPSDPIEAYVNQGLSYEYLEGYYNPRGYFDEVYCLSPWGKEHNVKKNNITYIRANPLKFGKIINQIAPDVIRGYGGFCCADWISINKVPGIPTIISVHDTNPELIHSSLKYADYIICMAECVKNAVLNKISFDEGKIQVMPNRIDTKLFAPKKDSHFFDFLNEKFGKGKHILHVGRKAEQKNLDTLIKALEHLDNEVKCIFVGAGDNTFFYNLAKECHVEKRCFFIESVQKEELPFWYSWCDCFCTPSRWEGFGYVFAEAAGCEAAIVTSNIAPMNEYLTDKVNAFLVDEYENPLALANALRYVLNGGEKIERVKKEARNVGLRFEKNKIDQIETSIYEKVIKTGAWNKKNNDWKLRATTWWNYR